MVRKLLKYDLSSLLRTIIPINMVLIVMALFVKILNIINIDHEIYETLVISVDIIYYLLAFVCCMLNGLVIVVRFYKNLFTSEGYMTFALPVKTTHHIASKYIASLIVTLITGSVVLLTDFFIHFKHSISYLFIDTLIYNINEYPSDAFAQILSLVLLIVFIMQAYLIVFACISLGQSMPGNRIAVSIGLFFAYLLGTFIIKIAVFITLYFTSSGYDFITIEYNNIFNMISLLLILYIIFKIAMGIVYYAINYYIIEKRLNLE